MKAALIPALSAVSAFVLSAVGQGTFQNLDFEAARVVFLQDADIATTNALPGWAAFSGPTELSVIAYNPNGATFEPVALYGSNALTVIGGSFSVDLIGGGSVRQTGVVPADAQLLLFKERRFGVSALLVSLNGQDLSYAARSTGTNYTLYGADISAFAGQTATLRFFVSSLQGSCVIDDIEFAVPEPSALALIGIGGCVAALRRNSRRKRASQR